MNKKTYIIGGIVALAVILALVGYLQYSSNIAENSPGPLDGFAQCLKDKGAKFYGAFWCPHCQAQKALFGSSKRLLPYEECSTPDAMGQLQKCTDIGIQSYPTWMFADNSTSTGELSLQQLADKTGCAIPSQTK